MNSPTLYQRVLGQDFFRLPRVLQQFHGLPQGGSAIGRVTVERNAGWFHHAAARLLHLPNAGEDVALHLQVIPQDNTERWIRQFGGQSVETLQWQEGKYLMEKAGPLYLAFQLTADEQGLTFHSTHKRHNARDILFPTGFAMRVQAQALDKGDRWHLEVSISTPLLGKITTYRGEIVPQLC